QTISREQSLFNFLHRARANSDPYTDTQQGRRVGSALVYAGLKIEEMYNDRVLTAPTGDESDWITAVKPSLRIEQALGRHNFALDGQADIRRYMDHEDENTAGFKTTFSANFEGYRTLNFPLW